ncbi:hypothetical protein SY88_17970 [Clostridiales bacterium PH28_bin88]|nr:hypothetical protein SY88_17970 [Clostridiales bacterium PH28_bin88]
MNMQQLEMFCLIVEKESFSEVARLLFMTQPAISFQIQSLEKSVGVQLFSRTRRGIELTPSGKTYYRYAKEMVNLHRQAMEIVHQFDGRVRERVIIGVETDVCTYILPRLLGCFKRKHPHLGIVCQAGNGQEVHDWLQKDLVDLCLVGNAKFSNGEYTVHPFLDDELVLAVAVDHPLASKENLQLKTLRNVQLVLREKGSACRELLEERLLVRGIKLEDQDVSMVVPDNEAIKAILQSGFGAAILSHWAIIKELNLNLLKEVRFAEPLFNYQISVVVRKEKQQEPEIGSLIDFLLARKVFENDIRCAECAEAVGP